MKFLLILSVLISPAQFMLIDDPPTKDKVTAENEKNPVQDKIFTVPTAKCRELSIRNQKSEQEACNDHCRYLKEFSGGDCVEEICRCQLDLNNFQFNNKKNKNRGKKRIEANGKVRNGVKCKNLSARGGKTDSENHRGCGVYCKLFDADNKYGHCVDGVCQCTKEESGKKPKMQGDLEVEEHCEHDEICLIHCRGLKEFNTGVCKNGTCRCSTTPRLRENHKQIPELKIRAVVTCEHRKKSVNEKICKSHCESFSRDHIHGRCVGGVCHCGYAVFEIMIPENEEKMKKVPKTKTRE